MKQILRGQLSSGSSLVKGAIEDWRKWAGFACIWLWTDLVEKHNALCGPLFSDVPGIFGSSMNLMLLSLVVTLAVMAVIDKFRSGSLNVRLAVGVGTVFLLGASACVIAGVLLRVAPLGVVGVLLGGSAFGVLQIRWAEVFARQSQRTSLVDAGCALFFSTVAFLLLAWAPVGLQLVALAGCALLCPYLLKSISAKEGDAVPKDERAPIAFTWVLLVPPLLSGLTLGLMVGIFQQDGRDLVASWLTMAVAELVGSAALLLVALLRDDRLRMRLVYEVGLTACVSALALGAIQGLPDLLVVSINQLGFTVYYAYILVYWGDLAQRTGRPLSSSYIMGFLSFQGPQLIGVLAERVLSHAVASTAMSLLFAAVLLGLFFLVLRASDNSANPLHQWLASDEIETTDEISELCSELASAGRLTPREHEVLSLLVRGRTASSIGRSLNILPSTAKSHIRSIYRKLDVHSQQELIDLVTGGTRSSERGPFA